MAKAKSSTATASSLRFVRTGNPWIDAGVVGLFRVLIGGPTYLKAAPGSDTALAGSTEFAEVRVQLNHDELVITGPTAQVESCLKKAYDRLLACYFNVSSKKQVEEKKNYNFYYDTQTDKFVTFPKKRPAGAALLLFDKAVRRTGGQEKWGPDPSGLDKGKRKPGILPPKLAHLQDRLDGFLAEHGLKPGPKAGLLLDGENAV